MTEFVPQLSGKAFVLSLTKGHAFDMPILREILKKELAAAGIPAVRIDSFFCPVGLPLGENSPNEIAISIVAQLLQERDKLKMVNN